MARRLAASALRFHLLVAAVAAVTPLVACSSAQGERARSYEASGVVRAIDRANRSVTIQHGDVPGYMPAMTMPFEVADLALLEGIAVGDRVVFRFTPEAGGRHVIRSLRKQ